MSRFRTQIQLNKPADFVDYIMQDFLGKELFNFRELKGEGVWQLGQGFLSCPQVIKYTYQNGLLTLEAWLRFALLPGVYIGEMGLTGFYGAALKSVLKNKVNNLLYLLNQPLPLDMQKDITLENVPPIINTNIGNQYGPINGQPIPVYTHDTSSKAGLSLLFGLISFFGILIPLAGIVLGTLGIVNSKKALKSNSRGLAIAGMIVSILGLIITLISWICGIVLIATKY